jgi:TatD family-associated radical SAM protein
LGDRYSSENRWPDLLAEMTGWEVVNLGVNGRQIPRNPYALRAMKEYAPVDLFLVMLGTNDLLQLDTPEAAAERMEAFLSTADPKKVVLVAPPAMVWGEWVQDQELIEDSRRLADLYEALSGRLGVRFLNADTWNIPLSYDGVVFCGYGEPTERLADMIAVCRALKERFPALPIRLNTNGQADLLAGRDTAPDFAGAFDVISISLNAPTAEGYQAVCRSRYGEAAFDAILSFAEKVKQYVPKVVFSVVRGTIPDGDLDKCQALADRCGVSLRIRDYIQT